MKKFPKVVFALHGIRTHADWQRAFGHVASNHHWRCSTDRWNYGYFSLVHFLLHFQRLAKVKWFRIAYHTETHDIDYQWTRDSLPSVVAHSFGTYILGNALLKYDWLKFDKVILCGSILPRDFPWDKLIAQGRVQAVRNEYGTKDIWTSIVGWFIQGTGTSGRLGFTVAGDRFEQEQFEYDHSEYFEKGHMEAKWIPFLERELPRLPHQPSMIARPKGNWPVGFYLIYLAVFAVVIFWWWRGRPGPHPNGVSKRGPIEVAPNQAAQQGQLSKEEIIALVRSVLKESGQFDNLDEIKDPKIFAKEEFSAEVAQFLAQLCMASYENEPLGRIGPHSGGAAFHIGDLHGFIVSYPTVTFLTFRGSDDLVSWITGLDTTTVQAGDGRVHKGLAQSLEASWSHISQLVAKYKSSRSLYIAGHSLGGALAILTAWRLEKEGQAIKAVYTFGAPRVGDADFAQAFKTAAFRLVNFNDIVARIPPHPYTHVGKLIYFDKQGVISEPKNRSLEDGQGADIRDGLRSHSLSEYERVIKLNISREK